MFLRRLVSVIFAVALTGLPTSSRSQPPETLKPIPGYTLPWDQAKMADLTQQLANTVAALRRDFAKQPAPQTGSKESRAYLTLSDDLRLIESESRELAARVAKRASADESYPVYRRLRILITDARYDASNQTFPHPLQQQIEQARGILIELDPYYGDIPMPSSP